MSLPLDQHLGTRYKVSSMDGVPGREAVEGEVAVAVESSGPAASSSAWEEEAEISVYLWFDKHSHQIYLNPAEARELAVELLRAAMYDTSEDDAD
jgi:hypothetical protein